MRVISVPNPDDHSPSVTVIQWFKNAGDSVEAGERLVRLESESGLIDLTAHEAGRLESILVEAGRTTEVGAELLKLTVSQQAAVESTAVATEATLKEATSMSQSTQHSGEVIPLLMPQAGQSMEEGTILKWIVAPGDRIEEGQVIYEVETDKATIEVEADHAGRLAKIAVQENETVAVKVPVAYLAENDSDVEAYLAQAPTDTGGPAAAPETVAPVASQPAASPSIVPAPLSGGRVKASPAARKAAGERGMSLAAVGAGSGPGGRILSTDVLAADAAGAPGEPTRTRLSGMRKAIARNLVASKQTIPHFYMKMTFDAAPMLSFYRNKKAEFKCSVNDVIVMACARVLREFPDFRSRIEGDERVTLPTANIGVAVGMEDGLVVPVIVGADRMTFEQLAAESRRVIEQARTGGRIEGMGQGVFTISNLGMFGVEEFSAIINPPEAAILAVGGVRETVIVRDGMMRPGRVMTATISCDHRVVDGLLAAQFMNRLKESLEAPDGLA